jgi:hypothetical protein
LIPIVLGIILAALGAVVIETFFTALFSLFPGLFWRVPEVEKPPFFYLHGEK